MAMPEPIGLREIKYLPDGTTDVTRTMHYGQPTPMQVEAYTRVLMGAIDLATLVFPQGTGDTDVDIVARSPLYEAGLDYRHGTGHGIGHFLGVHEAPTQVRIYSKEEHELEVSQFFSDEPGYYQDGEWGIRLETILTVVPTQTKYTFDKQFLGFEAVTLVPFEAKLIDLSLLSDKQCEWLNKYHARVLDIVGPVLVSQGRQQAYDWLVNKTEPLRCPGHSTTPVAVAPITSTSTQKTAEKTQTPYASGSTARQQSISRHANPPVSSTTKVLSAGAHVASSSFCLLVLSITLLVGNLRWR